MYIYLENLHVSTRTNRGEYCLVVYYKEGNRRDITDSQARFGKKDYRNETRLKRRSTIAEKLADNLLPSRFSTNKLKLAVSLDQSISQLGQSHPGWCILSSFVKGGDQPGSVVIAPETRYTSFDRSVLALFVMLGEVDIYRPLSIPGSAPQANLLQPV
jgi:hypothetical protein